MYQQLFYDFINLFFPTTCLACNRILIHTEKYLCTHCLATLPQTSYHLRIDNPVAQKFYGKVPLLRVAALYKFTKKSHVQKLLHQLKYKNQPQLAKQLGKYYGMLLKKTNYPIELDSIIPVPLHPTRLRERGYNQSTLFAQGLAAALCLPYHDTWLVRKLPTATQTKKTKQARWENVQLAFGVSEEAMIQGKQLLLVDDLITTGATLTACVQVLLANGAANKMHIAALATAT